VVYLMDVSILWQIIIQVLFYPVIYGFKSCKIKPTSKCCIYCVHSHLRCTFFYKQICLFDQNLRKNWVVSYTVYAVRLYANIINNKWQSWTICTCIPKWPVHDLYVSRTAEIQILENCYYHFLFDWYTGIV